MLYLITGRIGSGKTTHIQQTVADFAKNGERNMTLIVPEQFSFDTERKMLKYLGADGLDAVNVLSFSRLADKLVPPSVRKGRIPAGEASRGALMGLALGGIQDKLELYGQQVNNPSVITSFLSLTDELRQSCVTPEILENAANEMGPCQLQRKLRDIALVARAYSTAEHQSLLDPLDMMDYLIAYLQQSRYFAGKLVFIDAFRGFTGQELKIIECMLRDAKAVYVTLCMERPGEYANEDLFAHTKVTERRLKALAKKNGVSIIKPQNLSLGNKFNNFPKDMVRFPVEELGALEANLFDYTAPVYEEPAPAITLCSAPDVYAECEYIAATAKQLIQNEGFRCKDIAVIARNMDSYEAPLRTALAKCGVSVFEDKRQPVAASPLIALVSSALAVSAHGFQTENVLRFLKTGLTGLSCEEISALENYAYLWQINGSKWKQEWKKHPEGYGSSMKETHREQLVFLNELRQKAVKPLLDFADKMQCVKGEEGARAVVSLLEKVGADKHLKALAVALKEQGEPQQAAEQERLWDALMKLLNDFAGVVGETALSAAESERIFDLMLRTQTLGNIPQGLDEVTLGSAERVRLVAPKVVFIAGANYGVFPAAQSGSSALNDRDRRVLADMNIELASFGEYRLAEEKLIAYSAFCAAKQRLYVTYPARNGAGEATEPSELVGRIEKMFPLCNRCDTTALDPLYFVQSRQTAFEQMAKEKNGNSLLYGALREYFAGEPDYAGKLAALERAGQGRHFHIHNPAVAQDLFGKSMYLSPSRIEKYNKCRFAYFCEFGMKAKARRSAQIDVLQRGTIIHYVLENLLREYKGDRLLTLPAEERLQKIHGIMNEYLAEFLGGSEDKSPRFLHNYRLLGVAVNDIAERLVQEFGICAFRPVDFELDIGEDKSVPSYTLPLSDGGTLKIHGSIDRVDSAVIDGKRYLRVVDYKSGGKAFALGDVLNGLNMQMLVYLFALWQNAEDYYGPITPAGVLYYPAKAPSVTLNRDADAQKILQEKTKKCKMQGIVLGETQVVLAMEKDGAGVYLPAGFSEKDSALTGSVITLKQLAALKKKAEGLMRQMADDLKEGQIEAYPVKNERYKDVCEYCDYKSVCFYENTIERRVLPEISAEDALAMLAEEEENNG